MLTLWLLAAAGLALWCLDDYYPVRQWLTFTYLGVWIAALGWLAACVGGGLRLLRLARVALPFRERLLQGTAVGVLAYSTAMFLLGLVHALGAVTFFALPVAFLALGAGDLRRAWRDGKRRWQQGADGADAGSTPGAFTNPLVLAAWGVGLLGVTALYLNILTPGNLSYDSRWYHVALAEDYAASGAVHRFAEGSFQGSVPQLATYLYTWAFLLPGGSLFAHVELAAHVEFLLFVVTLFGLPLLVDWLSPEHRIRGAWAALFLFPGIFVYDATLNGGSDHVLAFWTIPLVLALIRFWRSPNARRAGLLAALVAAQELTKYQGMYVALPAVMMFLGRCLYLAVNSRRTPAQRREAWLALGTAAGVGVALTATLWLRNWIWYGNPVFPFMHERFATRPWSPDTQMSHDYLDPRWIPRGEGLAKLGDTILETLRFGFRAHDWAEFHGNWPVTGFLFTLLWPLPFLLPRARRLQLVTIFSLLGAFIWYYTLHQARYLTVLMPMMALSVLVTLNRLWRMNAVVRVAAMLVLAVQVAWGGDHPFLPSHSMLGQAALKHTVDVLAAGFSKQYDARLLLEPGLEAVGALLPRGDRAHTRVVIHGQHVHLGIGAPSITDAPEQQSGFDYQQWASPNEVQRNLRAMGATHIVWPAVPQLWFDWGSEAAFYDFVTHYLVDRAAGGGYQLGRIPDTLPPYPADSSVALRFCRGEGQTTLPDLQRVMAGGSIPPAPPGGGQPRFFVNEPGCPGTNPGAPYVPLTGTNGFRIWSRPLSSNGGSGSP